MVKFPKQVWKDTTNTEYRFLTLLDKSPNVVKLLDYVDKTSGRVLILEYAQFGDVAANVASFRTWGKGLQHKIVLGMLSGLAQIAKENVCHFDIKVDAC